ncbi:MAG: serine/threonine-protein kinase [Myxococcota bacterium]
MKRTAGPFEILEILGEGSFGTVCVARVSTDPLRRKVALKILKGAYATNEKILNRTRDEARLLSAINHPNIVRVERLMEIAHRPVVVMEHVQGVSLDQLLLRFKEGLPGAIALEVIRQTCLALHVAYAEALGDDGRPLKVIHRDIKPSNIMLSIHGEVKVLDFGIARGEFEGREARTESVVMGSRPYMAPERLDGVNDSQAVDVYSAGMSLFELLTGRPMSLSINPVSHDQAMNRQLQYVHIQGMTTPAVEDLRDLIRRMCAYTREYRPTAADCARDLEQLQYAMDRRYHIALDEFARTTVLPIYESRTRITPEEVVEESDELLREVTDALSAEHRAVQVPRSNTNVAPYIFVGLLGFVVVLLASLALVKFVGTEEQLRVEIWIPRGATAWYGEQFVATPAEVRVNPGPRILRIQLNDAESRTLDCNVDATRSVRWVGDDAVSVDNGQAQLCRPAGPGQAGPVEEEPATLAPEDATPEEAPRLIIDDPAPAKAIPPPKPAPEATVREVPEPAPVEEVPVKLDPVEIEAPPPIPGSQDLADPAKPQPVAAAAPPAPAEDGSAQATTPDEPATEEPPKPDDEQTVAEGPSEDSEP